MLSLRPLEEIPDGKVGPPCQDPKAVEEEGRRRINDRIPPGYADAKKSPDKAVGDYVPWVQTIQEAKRRQTPVLMVTNDEKEDWYHLDGDGRALGPRSELVQEMKRGAGQKFHLVNIRSFLVLANIHLSAKVSESTVEQAEHVGRRPATIRRPLTPAEQRVIATIAETYKPQLMTPAIREMMARITAQNNSAVRLAMEGVRRAVFADFPEEDGDDPGDDILDEEDPSDD